MQTMPSFPVCELQSILTAWEFLLTIFQIIVRKRKRQKGWRARKRLARSVKLNQLYEGGRVRRASLSPVGLAVSLWYTRKFDKECTAPATGAKQTLVLKRFASNASIIGVISAPTTRKSIFAIGGYTFYGFFFSNNVQQTQEEQTRRLLWPRSIGLGVRETGPTSPSSHL